MLKTIFSPFPYLETERLSLWQMEKSDAADVWALRADERVNKYIDRKAMQSIEEAENFIGKINGNVAAGLCLYWAVADKQTREFLGTVCIWNIVEEELKAELGYELKYDAQGKGYMQECIPKVLDFGFQKMELKKMEAVILDGNERSIKLAEKNGFIFTRKEGEELIFILTHE